MKSGRKPEPIAAEAQRLAAAAQMVDKFESEEISRRVIELCRAVLRARDATLPRNVRSAKEALKAWGAFELSARRERKGK